MNPILRSWKLAGVLGIAACGFLAGCGKSGSDAPAIAKSPKEAATQLEQAFQGADPALQDNVAVVAEALRRKEYERAVVSLETVRARENVSLQQGLAVHSSMVVLESELIAAMQAGDPDARRAYALLKQLKRN